MKDIAFDGERYNDDKMFVLYICKCTVGIKDDLIETRIYHENAPENHKWCVVTYRNVKEYRAVRVDHFDSKSEAINYVKQVEPAVPLISLNGKPHSKPLSYDQFMEWKINSNVQEYNYRKMYLPGGTEHKEVILTLR